MRVFLGLELLQSAQRSSLHQFEAAALWLEATTNNPKARCAMQGVARFLLCAMHTRDKQLSQIDVMDVRAYLQFLAYPQSASVWVSPTKHPR